jgi:DNA-binding LytR/AlgR family response regulator
MKTKTKPIPNLNAVHVGSRTYFLPEAIVMIEADLNYSLIHLANGKKCTVSICLKRLEEKFANVHSFTRVHRSYIVNTVYLKSINQGHIQLEHDLQCLVSRRQFKRLIEDKSVIF